MVVEVAVKVVLEGVKEGELAATPVVVMVKWLKAMMEELMLAFLAVDIVVELGVV